MFITQTYKSVNWLKNQTKEGGAMEEVLKTKKEDDIAFNIISKKFGRMWGSCDNTTALKLIEKNSGLNEILHKFPMKVYFDIDKTENLKADDITTYKTSFLNISQMQRWLYQEVKQMKSTVIISHLQIMYLMI
jgi:protein tyrosine phosphatase